MYRLGDKCAAIREIQKYLHFISDRITNEVPRIAIDGIYGNESKEAVTAFQEYKGIAKTGEVDYETFNLLYSEYLKAKFLHESENYFIDEKHFPLKLGDKGNEALLINLMLDELGKVFVSLGRVELKPYFSFQTEEAVKAVREIFMLDDSPLVDILLYDRMRYELLIRSREKAI